MSSPSNEFRLEIDEDIRQQRRVWLIERISWGAMALFLLAALSGLLGHGPFSSRTFTDPVSGLSIKYERFERAHAQALLRIQLQSPQSAARLSLGQEFLGKVELVRVDPEPVKVVASADRISYEFALAEPGVPATIMVHYKPLDFGTVEVELGLDDYPPQAFSQFVYP